VPPRQLQSKTPHDLETVCLKCLQKEAARRYPSAEALADDLRRFLDEKPVRARPPSVAYRLRKFVRRNKALTAFMAALVPGVAGAAGALVRANYPRDRAESAEHQKDNLITEKDDLLTQKEDLLADSYAHLARNHAQRGEWAEAVEYLDQALAGRHADRADW